MQKQLSGTAKAMETRLCCMPCSATPRVVQRLLRRDSWPLLLPQNLGSVLLSSLLSKLAGRQIFRRLCKSCQGSQLTGAQFSKPFAQSW